MKGLFYFVGKTIGTIKGFIVGIATLTLGLLGLFTWTVAYSHEDDPEQKKTIRKILNL